MTVTINGTTGIAGVDGSAATPAVQGADTNTGMFFPAADTIAFTEGGTEVMRIDSSGQVGIGTTSPDGTFEVSGTATTAYITKYASETASTPLTIRKSRGTEASPIVISAGDNLGSINFEGYDGANFSTAAKIVAQSDGTPGVGYMPGRLIFGTTANGSSSVTTRLTILSTGYVGIGNSSPVCILDVTGGIQTSRTTVTSPAATDGNIFSGTYTPTLTNSTNVAASTPVECFYTRVGNVVTVTGQVSIDVTTTLTDSVLLMSLPIASTFTAGRNCGGTGASSTSGTYGTETIAILANVAGGSAEFRLRPASVANLDYRFSFAYRVL